MSEYVYPDEALPEMGYSEPDVPHSCARCDHSRVTNAGAVHPGLECRLMVKLFRKKGIRNGNPQVNGRYGTCKFHTSLPGGTR